MATPEFHKGGKRENGEHHSRLASSLYRHICPGWDVCGNYGILQPPASHVFITFSLSAEIMLETSVFTVPILQYHGKNGLVLGHHLYVLSPPLALY
jgi:hypothetical protein